MLVCSYIHVARAKASEIIGRHRFKCLVQVSADAKTHKRSLWHILARYANQGRLLPQTFAVEFGKHTNTKTHTIRANTAILGNGLSIALGTPGCTNMVVGGHRPW